MAETTPLPGVRFHNSLILMHFLSYQPRLESMFDSTAATLLLLQFLFSSMLKALIGWLLSLLLANDLPVFPEFRARHQCRLYCNDRSGR